MRAQRARSRRRGVRRQQTVESYERKRTVVDVVVRTEKFSLHEPHVGMEPVLRGCARRRIRADAGQGEIGLADDAIEIENQRRIAAGS